MSLLVDDQVLAAHLRNRPVLPRAAAGEDLFTTGLWYVRLCLAVSRRVGGGRLSGPFAVLPEAQRQSAISAVLTLPPEIGLLSLRELGPRIGQLSQQHEPMNILTREALAAAVALDATVVLAAGNENPSLLTALELEQLSVSLVATD